jgi:hypothetical protein
MKTFALIFALTCSSLAMLNNSAEAAAPQSVFSVGKQFGLGNNSGLKSLNPQPLPPRWKFNPNTKALNPQPLPPRWSVNPGLKSLNPQPLPPRYLGKPF